MTSLTCPGEEGGAPIILSLTHSLIYLQSDSKSLTESWYKELERSHKVIILKKLAVIEHIMMEMRIHFLAARSGFSPGF